ncbi:MAG: hypothetical protein MUO23_02650 [Anaerolineales bacterium]|nr:hypothetical protein [Anaerolineales bacterium]
MITFRETLDSIERLTELLSHGKDDRTSFDRAVVNLTDLQSMLDRERLSQFRSPNSLAEYIERVAISQLAGIHDSLQVSADAHFDRLQAAQELSERLQARLRAVTEGANGGFFDGMS